MQPFLKLSADKSLPRFPETIQDHKITHLYAMPSCGLKVPNVPFLGINFRRADRSGLTSKKNASAPPPPLLLALRLKRNPLFCGRRNQTEELVELQPHTKPEVNASQLFHRPFNFISVCLYDVMNLFSRKNLSKSLEP